MAKRRARITHQLVWWIWIAAGTAGCVTDDSQIAADTGLVETGLGDAATPEWGAGDPVPIQIDAIRWEGSAEGRIDVEANTDVILEIDTSSTGGIGYDGAPRPCHTTFSRIYHTITGDEIRLFAQDAVQMCGPEVMLNGAMVELTHDYRLTGLSPGQFALLAPSKIKPWIRRAVSVAGAEAAGCDGQLPEALVGRWRLWQAMATPGGWPEVELGDPACGALGWDQVLTDFEVDVSGGFAGTMWAEGERELRGCVRPSADGWRLDVDPAFDEALALTPGLLGHLQIGPEGLTVQRRARVLLDHDRTDCSASPSSAGTPQMQWRDAVPVRVEYRRP